MRAKDAGKNLSPPNHEFSAFISHHKNNLTVDVDVTLALHIYNNMAR